MSHRIHREPVPERLHPAIRALFQEIQQNNTAVFEVERKAGLSTGVLWHWWEGASPRLHDLEAALQVVGREIGVLDRR